MTESVKDYNVLFDKGASIDTTPLLSLEDHARFQVAMRLGNIRQIMKYKDSDRAPYQVRLNSDMIIDPIHIDRCVFRPSKHFIKEGKYFSQSMDPAISTAQRELLAYQIDVLFGFGLTPPVVWKEVPRLGTGSLQAWVNAPSGVQCRNTFKYDYSIDTGNPWLHLLGAFDILIGNIDRHANNWLMDKSGKIYAIDNGYSFPKRNDCRFIYPLSLKGLIGKPVPDCVKRRLYSVQLEQLKELLNTMGFRCREESGVLRRFNYLKHLSKWEPVGRLKEI